MRSPTSVNTSAHNFSAVKMSSFSLKNITIYPSKVYKISSLRLEKNQPKKRVNLLSVLKQIKENTKTHTREKQRRDYERNTALARCIHEREDMDAHRKTGIVYGCNIDFI